MVIQCFEDEYWPVRKVACNSLAKTLVTRYKDRAERKLYEGAIDPSHYVRTMCYECEKMEKFLTDIFLTA